MTLPVGTRVTIAVGPWRGQGGSIVPMASVQLNGHDFAVQLDDEDDQWPLCFDFDELEVAS